MQIVSDKMKTGFRPTGLYHVPGLLAKEQIHRHTDEPINIRMDPQTVGQICDVTSFCLLILRNEVKYLNPAFG